MDARRRPFSNAISNTNAAVQSHSHHNPSSRPPLPQSGPRTPTSQSPKKLSSTPWFTPSTPKYTSPSLRPLISKFEALDADSLTFNVRDAQPPHLRLPLSRMGGRRGQGENVQHVKTTRGKLLALFDRPGWGARTLRGLRDGGGTRDSEDMAFEAESRPSRSPKREAMNQSKSPHGGIENDTWVPTPRPGLRRESKIRDKIKLFDGGMNLPPAGYNNPWQASRADGANHSQYPTSHQPRFTPTKQGKRSGFSPSHGRGILTPIKSYGYLRPKEVTPLPWRPLDSRAWETVGQLKSNTETPIMRGRRSERAGRSLVSPIHADASSAVKKVQITYRDPKRLVSAKVDVLFVARPKEKYQEQPAAETENNDQSTAMVLHKPLPSPESVEQPGTGHESAVETDKKSETDESILTQGPKPGKARRMSDRGNSLNNGKQKMANFDLPMTRMRNQSTPIKLPFQPAHDTPMKASTRLPQPSLKTPSGMEKRRQVSSTITAVEKVISDIQQEAAEAQQQSQPQSYEQAPRASIPRKSSRISEKIQHFETFANRQAPGIGTVITDDTSKRSIPQSKRIQTWPIPSSDDVFFARRTDLPTTAQDKSTRNRPIIITAEDRTPTIKSPPLYRTPTKNEKPEPTNHHREKTQQKILSRQERLTRRARSRSRPRPSRGAVEEGLPLLLWGGVRDASPRGGGFFERAGGQQRQAPAGEEVNAAAIQQQQQHRADDDERLQEVWMIDAATAAATGDERRRGSLASAQEEVVVVMDTVVVAQCELAEPRPLRLAETVRMIKLCRGRFGARSVSWRRMVGRSLSKEGGGGSGFAE